MVSSFLGGVVSFYMLLFVFGTANGIAFTSQAVAFEFQYKIHSSKVKFFYLLDLAKVYRFRFLSENIARIHQLPNFVRKAILVIRTDEAFCIREIRNPELGKAETQRMWLHISNVSRCTF
jgi:hypothetical protein